MHSNAHGGEHAHVVLVLLGEGADAELAAVQGVFGVDGADEAALGHAEFVGGAGEGLHPVGVGDGGHVFGGVSFAGVFVADGGVGDDDVAGANPGGLEGA